MDRAPRDIVAAAALLGTIAILARPTTCGAQTTITVNTLSDPTGGGKCTLRQVILLAQSNSISDVCSTSGGGSPYTILFSNHTGVITFESSLPIITGDLSITGS